MPSVRCSAKAVIIQKNRILCNKSIDWRGVHYHLPGGGQRHGETLVEAVKRECPEELGIRVQVHDVLYIRDFISKKP